LIASNPGADAFKVLLPLARQEALAVLEHQGLQGGQLSAYASVALHVDHLLYVLTSGMFGEYPGAPR